jgi:hypothetical protein
MVSPELKAMFEERGVVLVPADRGVELFVEQFEPAQAHDVVTLLGPTMPLSAVELPAPAGSVIVERDLSGVATDPLVTDHAVGGSPLLPVTGALGWCIASTERLTGATVVGVRDLTVYKGITFDADTRARPYRLQLTHRSGPPPAVEAKLTGVGPRGGGPVPHYAATLLTAGAGTPGHVDRLTGLPGLGGGSSAADLYTDGTLFHGPSLRGIRRILAEDRRRLVLECALPERHPADGAYSGARFNPASADLLLQAALVWVRRTLGDPSLPVGIGEAELLDRLPDAEPFLVVVEPVGTTGPLVTVTVTACQPDGRVLHRFARVALVTSTRLEEKFVATAPAIPEASTP